MQAVDYNIRAKLHGRFREQLMHAEMRPVRLIHDQGQAEACAVSAIAAVSLTIPS